MSIGEYFEKYGEARFREVECEVIKELSAESSLIIATGGGAVLREENVSNLKQSGKIYFIDRPLSDLIPTDDRPLSRDRSALEELYNQRYPVYCEVCDVRIDADCDANSVSEKILENLK
jgi:shikimate dehydrogenase